MKKISTLSLSVLLVLLTAVWQTLSAQTVLFHEEFEGGVLPAGWTTIDADGDGYGWEGSANPASYFQAGTALSGSGHNGSNGFVLSGSYSNVYGVLTPDNWLITPAVTLTSDATLSFWVCAQDVNYAAEHYGVYISTTGAATTDFVLLYEETLDANGGAKAQGLWKQKTVDLSEYTGQAVRIAFRHFNCSDMFVLNLDDVEITTAQTVPVIAANPSTLHFDDVLLGHSKTSRVEVSTYNLASMVTITTTFPFSVSVDGTIFDTVVSLPDSGGSFYVRYSPTTVGTDNGVVLIVSDSLSLSIAVSGNGIECSVPNILPFVEDFDGDEFPPACWNLISQNEETWKKNYYVTNWAFCKWSEENKTEQLETCVLDLSQATHPVLRFDFMSNYEYVGWGYVDFKIYTSTDGGDTYSPTPIWELSQFGPFEDWTKTKARVDLVAFAGQSAVKFKFSYEGQYCSVYFDNVEIKNAVVSPEMIVYVKQNASGTGDGSSWDNAMDDILEAIGIASLLDGVQVWVATGTYYGDTTAASENAFTVVDGVNVYGGFAGVEPANYDLSLRDLELNETILDGLNERRVLIQPMQYGNYHTIWDGFTIQNGRSTGIGGGAYIIRGMTLGHCRIHNNYSDASGGGVYIYNNARVADCRIYNNESSDCGGGLYANAAAVINSCIISNNVAAHQGGGIYANTSEVRNCLISNNTVSSGYNTDAIGGGAFSSNSTIINSTIVRNEGKGFYGSGNVINCIVWGNSDPVNVGGDGFTCSYSAIENGCVGEGNIHLMDVDGYRPLFVNPALVAGNTDATTSIDWHLQEGSVCINKGNNAVVTGNFDLDGTARIKRDTVDLGCYESDYYNVSGDSTIYVNYTGVVYVTQTGAGNFSGNNWENAMSSLETAQVVALTHNAVVWVAAGIYYGDTTATSENAFAMVEGVNVYGGFAGNEPEDYDLSLRDFGANATILDGQNVRRVLYGYEKTDVVWDGFTITNGNVGGGEGGGVYMKGDILLSNCVINNNSAGSGGGVYAVGDYRGKPEILSCEISNNVTSWPGAEHGGGLYVEDCYLTNCMVQDNNAGSNSTGGGVYLWGNSKMRNCIISGNTARFGGGVSCGTGGTYGPSIINCLISNNSASEYDGIGGVRCYSKVIVNNSTIVSNKGGGLSASYDSLLLSNSIVWGNQTSDGISSNLSGTVFCSYSAVEDGAAGNQNILLSDAFQQAPLFVHPSLTAGASDTTSNVDWHLQQESPCINRGDNSVVTDSVDLDGTARIKRDTVDLGCYESDYYNLPVGGDTAVVEYAGVIYVTQTGAGTHSGNSWDNATSSIEEAQSLAQTYNAVVWVAAGTYYGDTLSDNAFTMHDGVNVYGGFAGNEPADYDLSMRDLEANATILDGMNARRVLNQGKYFDTLTLWDGFVIQNGWTFGSGGGADISWNGMLNRCKITHNHSDIQGGGVRCYHSIVSNCEIVDNSSDYIGGGLEAYNYCRIENCRISYNTSVEDGGGVSLLSSDITVVNCLINNNTSLMKGGGISGFGIILNSTIVRNASRGTGAGINGNATTRLQNCIVWGNEKNGAPDNLNGSEIICSHCAVEGLYPGTDMLVLGALTNQNPAFVTPTQTAGAEDVTLNADWHLQNGSVCANRGNNGFVTDSTDLDGMPRIINDTVDLGCFESNYYSVPSNEYLVEYQGVVYVTPTGAGQRTGADWGNAVSSINDALLIASVFDLDVWVAEGTYYGDTLDEVAFNIVKGVDVYGGFAGNEPADYDLSLRDFAAHASILDGQYKQRVLYQSASFDTTTVWDGFTMRHAKANSCVVLSGGSVLSNCIVSDNMSRGIYAEYATVRNCTVSDNTAPVSGAGICADHSNVVNCTVSDNSTNYSAGGIYATYSNVSNCTVSNNTTTSYAGGIYANYSDVVNCVVSKNTATSSGGGIYANYSTIRNCLTSNNSSYGNGGGVYCNGSVNLVNSTIVRNSSDYGGAGVYDNVSYSWNSPAKVTNCIVWGNEYQGSPSAIVGTYTDCSHIAVDLVEGWQMGENVLVLRNSQASGFVHPSMSAGSSDSTAGVDWHLSAGSVCINRGIDSLVVDSLDLDGTARIKRDTVDLGCYESDYFGIGEVFQHVYVVPGGAGNMTGDDWENAVSTIGEALQLGQVYISDVWVAAGTYYGDTASTSENAFTMVDGVSVYGGFAGNEPADYDLSLRDLEANATVLDGQNARRVLFQTADFTKKTTWDGLVIQNGRVNGNGGGAYLRGNSVLSNSLVQNNVAYSPYTENDWYEYRYGGGIYAIGSSSYSYVTSSYVEVKVQIRYCRIRNNKVESENPWYSYGGGVYAAYTDICSSEVLHNMAKNACGGIGLSRGTVTNCLIANNTSLDGSGGGIYIFGPNNINNSTIVRNSSEYNGAGVGLSGQYSDTLKITNCIIWGNRTHSGLSSNVHDEYVSADCSYSAIEDDFDQEGIVLLSDQNNQHPQFANPSLTAGWTDSTANVDWHLLEGSVCINRGNNIAVMDSVDLDGTARVKRDTIDLGCYESDYYSAPLTEYSGIVYVTQTGSGDFSGNSWANAKSSIYDAQMLASVYDAMVWVAAGTYYGDTDSLSENAFTMRDGVSVYGGFAGDEPADYDLSLRDFETNATILDGQNARRVLYQPENFNTRTSWDGFTIQNGHANGPGGGVYMQSNARLVNCLVENNVAMVPHNNQGITYGGGGVCVKGSYNADSSEVAYCRIRNNETQQYGDGGGVWASYTVIHHSDIVGNRTNTTLSCFGGGIYASSSTVLSCTILRNTAVQVSNNFYYYSYGGGIYLDDATVVNSLIADNSAYYGGGVYGFENGELFNTTVVSNNADNYAGVYMLQYGVNRLVNSVVWGNRRANGSASNLYGSCHTVHSAVEGGVSGNDSVMVLSGENSGLDVGVNYPFFVSPQTGDYRLCKYSALVNAGDNNVQMLQTDLSDMPRVFADTIDIGCYEFHGESFCSSPKNLAVSDVSSTSALLTWQNPNPDEPYAYEFSYKSEDKNQWSSVLVYEPEYYVLAGLQPQTIYAVRMRTLCDDVTPTEYTSEVFFVTRCSGEYASPDTIGNTSTTNNGQYLPLGSGSYFSYSQQIYQASEIEDVQVIDTLTLAFTCPGYNTSNNDRSLDVYIGHTDRLSFDDQGGFVPSDSLTLVYSGIVTFNYSSYGKLVISLPLKRPFRYNGMDNLVVAFDDNTGTYGPSRKFYTHQTQLSCGMYSGSGSDIDPANPAAGTLSTYRMNLILPGVCENGGCDLSGLSVMEVAENTATLLVQPGTNADGVEVQYKESASDDYLTIPTDSVVVQLTGLKQNMDYVVRARSVCGDTSSLWTYRYFTTDVKDLARIYVTTTGQGEGGSWEDACNDLNYALSTASRIASVFGHTPDIWVAAGTYHGDTASPNAFTMAQGVNVYGGFVGNEPSNYDVSLRDVETNATVLDGQNSQRVLYQSSNYSVQTIWDGFTIQNGFTSSYGGGAYLRSRAQLSHCKLMNNHAKYGGGAYVAGYGSVIRDCRVSDNSAVYKGGGIQALTYSTVANCVISGNSTTNSVYYYYGGGGIYAEDATIVSCVISNNSTVREGGAVNMTSTQVRNCLLANNSSNNAGGGVHGSGSIINSTIVNNRSGNGVGGLLPWGTVTLTNSIVWGNQTGNGTSSNLSDYNLTCSRSAIEGGCEGDSIITLGVEISPMFVNPSLTAGSNDSTANVDWHLQEGSVCVNRGVNALVTDSLDLDGSARVKRDTVDLGCYESDYYSVPVLYCTTVYSEFSDTACDSYVWNDQSYTHSGNYTQTFELPNGCDSVVTLHLTVKHSVTTHEYVTICENELPYMYGDTIFEVGTSQFSIFNSHFSANNCCDSVATLHLTVLPSTLGEFAAMTPTNNYPVSSYPIHFTWDGVENASDYDLYVWPAGESQPQQPTASQIHGTHYTMAELPNHNVYQWFLKAYNACDTSESIARQFSLNVMPSLTVTAGNPVDFGEVQLNSVHSVFFQVTGTALDSLITYRLTGVDSSSFSLVPTNTWDSLHGGRMQLTFHPTVPKGEYTAQMTFQSDSLVKTITVKGYLSDYLTFTTYVDTNVYAMDSEISIHGRVTNPLNEPVAGLEVEIYVSVMEYVRTYPAISDVNGQYTVTFTPQHSEAGYYTVGSRRAGGNSLAEHDDFNIPGMMLVSSDWILWKPTVDQPDTGTIAVRNRSQIPLTNIQVTPLSLPNGCTVQFVPLNIAGMATGNLQYIVSSSEVSTGVNYEEVRLSAASDEGAAMNFSAWYYCLPQRADLDVTPTSLITTMTRGKSKVVDFMIYNNGTGPTGNIYVSLPDVSWMSVVGGDTLPSLAVHDSAYVSIRLSADSTTELVRYTGNFAINCERGEGVSIPYSITAISDSTGTLVVDVTDEYTWNTNNGHGPHLAGANVTLKGYYSLETVATGVTDANGQFVVNDLPEGWYKLIVRADKHEEYQNNLYITAGDTNLQDIFISFQAITYSWEVVPTEIEDEYTYDLNVEFETHVPKPVIVVETSRTIPELEPGESMNFDLIITNHGLIAGFDLEIFFPVMDDYVFTPLISVADTIPALTTLIIPVNVRKKENEFFSAKVYWDGMELQDGQSDSCRKRIGTKCNYVCGHDKRWVLAYSKPVFMNTCLFTSISVPYLPAPDILDILNNPILSFLSKLISIIPSVHLSSKISCDTCDFLLVNIVEGCAPIIGDIVSAAEGDFDAGWATFEMVETQGLAKTSESLYKAGKISWGTYNAAQGLINQGPVCDFHLAMYLKCQLSKELKKGRNLFVKTKKRIENFAALGKEIVSKELAEYSENCYYLIEFGKEFISNLRSFTEEDIAELVQRMSEYDIPEPMVRQFSLRWNAYVNGMGGGLLPSNSISKASHSFQTNSSSFELTPINAQLIDSLSNAIWEIDDSLRVMGYTRMDSVWHDAMSIFDSVMNERQSSSSVCSSVTVQFSQKMTMTREAFEGTLTINNGHESQPMQDIDVDFVIRDEDGVDCTNLFQINFQSYNNMTGSNGSLVLDALNEGSIVVQFIPTKQAAPTMPKQYSFGGSFSFIDPFTGESMTYDLYPVDIMVNPSPDLYVNYFMQRDILGDDPLTEDRIEPIVPAELGVIIHNRGAGTAKNVLLETAEPQIIENEKGLAIDFAMYGASFNGQERQLGLMEIPFGNIEPNHTGVGEWWFTSTLLGHFVSYEAHVIHNNSFGNPDLSLVSSLDIHPLIHTVYAYGDLDDGINDFLVDDEEDSHNYPDSLYFSNGSRTGVATADSIGFDHYVTPLDTIVILTLDPSRIGWNYEQTWDPGRGQYKLISCTRNSDQQVIPLSNVWQTHVTIPVGADPVYENKLHIVDTLSNDLPTTYTLVFSLKEVVLEVDTILDVPDAIITSPLSEVTVKFNKPIVDSTFNYLDMSLKCNNGANLLDENMSLERLDSMTYKLHLEPYTGQSGYYVLNIQTLDITDVDGFNGYYAKQAAWIQNIITCQPDSVSISTVACDNYDWYGTAYTSSGDYTHTLTNASGCDSVVTLHLTVNYSNTGDTTAVVCDSFDWYGATYTSSGDYSYTLTNASGCDSVVTLHLTVNYSNTGDTTTVVCDSFDWYGTTYTSSGDYSYTLTNANGCDSVVTLHLTVNYSNTGDTTAVACDSYDWFGATYTASGDYTYTLTNASGCDSVVTLHLTVNYSNTGDTAVVACDSFDWYGATYTTSGDYTHTLTNASGCDSVVTLHLTVNYSNIGDTTAVACDSYDWFGATYTSSGDYTYTLTNASGCDSVVTLHLTVNYSNTGDTTAVVCDSFYWYGTTYTSSGDYSHTLTNVAGCDSVVTLHLTVNYSNTGDTAAVVCDSFDWYGTTYTASGDYTYTLTNASGCDSVVTLHLTVNYSNTGDTTAVVCDSFYWYGATYTSNGDYTYTLTNASGCDSVVTLHLTVNYSNTGDTAVVVCDSFDWYGTTYTTSGDYTHTLTNASGCDSVVTLHLTVNYSNAGDTTAVVCDSFYWYGATYTSNGDYTYTLTNASGCDSVVTLHLTVNYSNTGDTTAVVCDSFDWYGATYTTSGDYTHTHTNASGCDSVVTLHLTVNYSNTGDTTAVVCDSFDWYGATYTTSGDYTHTLTNASGCDSVVTLHLTVNYSNTGDTNAIACDSYAWNDSVYTQSGDYVQTFTNVNGCDSIVTLHLTVNHSVTAEYAETACGSYTWNDSVYTQSGDYVQTFTNADGCDSVVTLHLTVNPTANTEDYLTICESELPYHYSNGLIDTTFEVGTAELLTLNYYLLTESGCDSIVTFYLTVEPTDSTEFAVTTDSCYIWNGLAYCASGDYTQIIQNAYGCDSVVTLHLTVTVGIDGYNGFDVVLYPNPAKEVVNVQCTMYNVQEVEVFDVFGKLVTTTNVIDNPTQINVSSLANGMYFVRVTTDRGTVTKPFVKK